MQEIVTGGSTKQPNLPTLHSNTSCFSTKTFSCRRTNPSDPSILRQFHLTPGELKQVKTFRAQILHSRVNPLYTLLFCRSCGCRSNVLSKDMVWTHVRFGNSDSFVLVPKVSCAHATHTECVFGRVCSDESAAPCITQVRKPEHPECLLACECERLAESGIGCANGAARTECIV